MRSDDSAPKSRSKCAFDSPDGARCRSISARAHDTHISTDRRGLYFANGRPAPPAGLSNHYADRPTGRVSFRRFTATVLSRRPPLVERTPLISVFCDRRPLRCRLIGHSLDAGQYAVHTRHQLTARTSVGHDKATEQQRNQLPHVVMFRRSANCRL